MVVIQIIDLILVRSQERFPRPIVNFTVSSDGPSEHSVNIAVSSEGPSQHSLNSALSSESLPGYCFIFSLG